MATGDLDRAYELGIGTLRLDLSALALPPGETHVAARIDIGDLYVTVPADAALRIDAHAKAGNVEVLGESSDGWQVERHTFETGDRTLVLDARVGAGSIRVDRAVP